MKCIAEATREAKTDGIGAKPPAPALLELGPVQPEGSQAEVVRNTLAVYAVLVERPELSEVALNVGGISLPHEKDLVQHLVLFLILK